jgi:hypothetical protein
MLNDKRWFGLSMIFSLYFALVSLHYAFSQEYLIQDDARIHIAWLERFIDPELFPDDFLADYFTYFAPVGFKSIYWLGSKIGIKPLILAKILPSILGLVTAIYAYFLSLEISPKSFTAFLSSLLITQLIWSNDDLISATPRAFVYPLLAAFLYYLAKDKLLLCLATMFIMGLFYPQVLLVETTVLTLRYLGNNYLKKISLILGVNRQEARGKRQQINRDKNYFFGLLNQQFTWLILGLIIAAIALISFYQRSSEWSIVVTASDMHRLPEFNLNGRSYFYGVGWLKFILAGDSGICLPIFPPIVWCGFALPWLLNKPSPTIKLITSKVNLLWQVTIASLLMFLTAHLLLLKIHLPSRYTYHTLRFILAIASAIVITVLLDMGRHWLLSKKKFKLTEKIAIALVTIFAINVIIFPMIPSILFTWCQNWRIGQSPTIYQYLAQQPKDIMIASLSIDANNIPAFARRSILVGEEFAFAYHPYYYQKIQQRATDLIEAQYSTDKQILLSFIDRYGIDFILLDKTAFTPEYLQTKNWLVYSSWQNVTNNAIKKIKSLKSFLLPPLIKTCAVVSTPQADLLDAECIHNQL